MNVRYVSQDFTWDEAMKESVRQKIVEPLARHLNSDDFELSIHFQSERKRRLTAEPRFEMWAVLQTFDGRTNQVVRCAGTEFKTLVNEVSHSMRNRLRKSQRPWFSAKSFLINPFRMLPFERTA